MKKLLIIAFAMLLVCPIFAQTPSATRGSGNNIAQPIIMVVPYFTKNAGEIVELIETDKNVEIYLNLVREAFTKRGFQTKDFMGVLNSSNLLSELRNNAQEDKFTQIMTANQVDMYVKVNVVAGSDGRGNYVTLSLACMEATSGASIANSTQNSGSYRDVPDVKLVMLTVESVIDDFMVQMQGAFDKMIEEGRVLKIDFAMSNNSALTFFESVGDAAIPLAQVVIEWIENNAFNGQYSQSAMDDKLLVFSEVRVPLRDLNTGRPYNLNNFAFGIISHLSKVGVKATPKVTGQGIVFTIQ